MVYKVEIKKSKSVSFLWAAMIVTTLLDAHLTSGENYVNMEAL